MIGFQKIVNHNEIDCLRFSKSISVFCSFYDYCSQIKPRSRFVIIIIITNNDAFVSRMKVQF